MQDSSITLGSAFILALKTDCNSHNFHKYIATLARIYRTEYTPSTRGLLKFSATESHKNKNRTQVTSLIPQPHKTNENTNPSHHGNNNGDESNSCS
jgi:hypothetical protein